VKTNDRLGSSALAIFVLFWRFDPQLRGDLNQGATIAIFALTAHLPTPTAHLLSLMSCSIPR
jgi:hypothetical protein